MAGPGFGSAGLAVQAANATLATTISTAPRRPVTVASLNYEQPSGSLSTPGNACKSLNSKQAIRPDTICVVLLLNQWLPMTTPPDRTIRLLLITFTLLVAVAGCDQTGSRSAATPTPTPASTVPVVYFERPPSDAWQAVDWNGTLHGLLPVQGIGTGIGIPQQSPDGSRLLWPTNDVYELLDRRGQLLSVPDLSTNRGVTWADDSSGICTLDYTTPTGHSYRLDFKPATGGSRTIATFSTAVGPDIAACSPKAGLVVVTTATGYKDPATELRRVTFGELLVIDFKSGNVLHRQAFPVGPASTVISSVAVSHDGALAALGTQTYTTVVNLASGQTVARFRGVTALAFSWDGTLLAVATNLNHGELLRPATGQVVWSDPQASRFAQGGAPNPEGSDVMFLLTTGSLDDLFVVAAGGATRIVARDVFVGELVPCADCSAA